MTISEVRFYYYPRRQRLERYLTMTHWGFAEWFTRRLRPIREQLRGPEVKGVNIVNFMLHEQEGRHGSPMNDIGGSTRSSSASFATVLHCVTKHPSKISRS